MSITPRRKLLSVISCPGCAEIGLHKISYGLPSDDFDFEKNIVGGCIMSDDDIGCKKCGWTGNRDQITES